LVVADNRVISPVVAFMCLKSRGCRNGCQLNRAGRGEKSAVPLF
jgi:hypothetical protein